MQLASASPAFCAAAAGSGELLSTATALLCEAAAPGGSVGSGASTGAGAGAGSALTLLQSLAASRSLAGPHRAAFAAAVVRPLLALAPRQLQLLLLQLLVGRDAPVALHETAAKLLQALLEPQPRNAQSPQSPTQLPGPQAATAVAALPAGVGASSAAVRVSPADGEALPDLQLALLRVTLAHASDLVFATPASNATAGSAGASGGAGAGLWATAAAAGGVSRSRLTALQALLLSAAAAMPDTRGVLAVFELTSQLASRVTPSNAEELLAFKPLLGFAHGVLRLCAQPGRTAWLSAAAQSGSSSGSGAVEGRTASSAAAAAAADAAAPAAAAPSAIPVRWF